MKILIMLPAYNEEDSIEQVISDLIKMHPKYDYIILNDCSTDLTKQIISKRGYQYISLPINLGIGGNVQTGYIYARENDYDIAIQMDGDGQHDPSYINDLIQPILEGKADMVVGSRFIEKQGFQSSFLRRIGIQLIRGALILTGKTKILDTTSGFRACSTGLIHFYSQNYAYDYPEPEAILSASLNGYRIVEIPVKMKDQAGGTSSINGFKSAYYMIKVILSLVLCRISYKKRR